MASFLQQLVGSKPSVPELPSLDLSTEQQKALAANLKAIPGAEQIATRVDLFNQQQIDKMLENVIPNYKAITTTIGQNLAALNAGQIPTDVSQAVQSSDAAMALGGGYAGTEAGKNLVARDLGLTSLDLTQRGLMSTESWMKTANSIYAPGQFNVSSMFISPAAQASFDVEERNAQFQNQWMKNQIAAMPAPWAEDLKQFVYRAMSIYSGTPVGSNPYSTPGSMPQVAGGSYTPTTPSPGAGEGGAGFDQPQNINLNFGGADYGGELAGGGGGGLAGLLG